MLHKSRMRRLSLALIVLMFSEVTFAQERTDIPSLHFAGLAFAGNAANIPETFPHSSALLGSVGNKELIAFNQLLVSRLRERKFSDFNISLDLGDYKKGDSLALAFVLSWEDVAEEKLGGVNKISVNLQAQAMLFDFETKQVIASLPFGASYIDATSEDVTTDRIKEAVAVLYGAQSGGMIDGFMEALERITPKKAYGARIQITETIIAPEASATLESAQLPAESAATMLASAFERYLSMNGRIPVLPQTKGQAIGGAMSARFSNGDVYNLVLPEPDYQISLRLTNVRKVELSRTGAEVAWAYASYLEPTILEPLSGTKYLDAAFKYAVVKVISVNGALDDSASYQESLLSISDQVTQQLGSPQSEWLNEWGVRGADPAAMSKVTQILEKCR